MTQIIDFPSTEAANAAYVAQKHSWNNQEILDHEISVLQALVDRNGFGAVKDWLDAYQTECDQHEKELNDEFFRWSVKSAGDPMAREFDDLF